MFHIGPSPSIGANMSAQSIGKLTAEDLNDVQKDTRSKTYWHALRPAAIPKLLFRTFAVLMALASIAAVSLVAALSFGCYGVAMLLGRIRRLTRRLSISLAGLRPLHLPAWPRSSAGLPRHPCVTNHGLPHPYRRADFRDPTRFRETSTSARDRFLSFPLRSQGSALCEDVQRQTLGGTPAPRVLLGQIR